MQISSKLKNYEAMNYVQTRISSFDLTESIILFVPFYDSRQIILVLIWLSLNHSFLSLKRKRNRMHCHWMNDGEILNICDSVLFEAVRRNLAALE